MPSALTEALSNVTLTVVAALSTSPSNVPSSVGDGRPWQILRDGHFEAGLRDHDIVRVLVIGLSMTKLPSAESSVSGKLFGSGVSVVDAWPE